MRNYILLVFAIGIFACNPDNNNKTSIINIAELKAGDSVKKSGKKLISQPIGFVKIIGDSTNIDSTLIITVHGYKSDGYEWIQALNDLTDNYSNVYFYRYDWNTCPDEVGLELTEFIDSLINLNQSYNNVEIYGHSYGGLVITYAASEIETRIPTEIHTIAAPLAGYPRLFDNCNLQFDDNDKIIYDSWDDNISHFQWRTQKEFDGAFRDLEFDPQNVNITSSVVTILPDSMDGHRLGHNWSVTWVINKISNNE